MGPASRSEAVTAPADPVARANENTVDVLEECRAAGGVVEVGDLDNTSRRATSSEDIDGGFVRASYRIGGNGSCFAHAGDADKTDKGHAHDATAGKGSSDLGASLSQVLTAERGVPQFDGALAKWKEYEKRALIFIARMTIEKKSSEAAFMLASGLTGAAWDFTEDQLDVTALTEEGAAAKLIQALKARFKMDDRAELADDFEAYFYKLKRVKGETLFDFISRVRMTERKLKTHDLQLPEKIRAWMLLRKAGYDANQKALIMSIVGVKEDFTFDKVAEALEATFGQESTVFEHDRPRRQYYGEDTEEEFYDAEETYAQDDYADTAQDEDQFDERWPDAEEEYYQQATGGAPLQPDPDETYHVEEYDEVYANYVDARKRFNDLRLSRGSYPVMAVVDSSAGSSGQMPRTSASDSCLPCPSPCSCLSKGSVLCLAK